MRRLIIIAIVVLIAPALAPAAGAGVPGPADLLAAAARAEPITVDLGPLGVRALRLRPNLLTTERTRYTVTDERGRARHVPAPDVRTLHGEVVGARGSVVSLTVAPGFLSGFVATAEGAVSFEPGRTAPVPVAPSELSAEPIDEPVPIPGGKSHGSVPVSALGAGNCALGCGTLTTHIILDGDATFAAAEPSTCFARELATLNDIDAIYALEATDIRFEVTQQNCWGSNVSLGDASTAPVDYLTNLRFAWSPVGEDRSTVLHVTGFDWTASTIGIAYVGGICTRLEPATAVLPGRCPFGYAIYQGVSAPGYAATAYLRAMVAAHEIGHNFDAEHGTATGCGSGAGTIMCANVQPNGPNRFSAASARVIREHAEATVGYLVCPVGRDGETPGTGC